MSANWNERWNATWSVHRKNTLVRMGVSLAGSFAAFASVSMLSHGFFPHWDPVRRELARDPGQALSGIAVLVSAVFALKYGRLVADTLHPLPTSPTIREAAAADVARANLQPPPRSKLVLPGDADFRI